LLRNRFRSNYYQSARLETPCWSLNDLPISSDPSVGQRSHCLSLITDVIDWIREYEVRVLEEMGLPYRRQVLQRWNDGKRLVIPPEEVPAAWRQFLLLLENQPGKFLPRCLQDV